MKLQEIKDLIPDYGRDIRLNLDTLLSGEGIAGLTVRQVWGTALSCAYSIGTPELVRMVLAEGASEIDDTVKVAAQGASTIMAMNNIYYRSMHLMEDAELKRMPARLRMNIIGKPGIPKEDFELMCFAVSALSGCGQCLTSHLQELRKAAVTDEGIQGALKLASVLNATDRALKIREL